MNTVLQQELVRYNNLTAVIAPSLVNIKKAIKGTIVMSAALEMVGDALFFGKVPSMWMAQSYPSLKPLSGYVVDLVARLEMFGKWLVDKPPSVFWLSGFYFTQAFLTGCLQNFARKYGIPIDDVVWNFDMMPKPNYKKKPKDGAYIRGLFFDGARWDAKALALEDPLPKQLFVPGPVMWFKPVRTADVDTSPHYECPVYKTSERRGILATTGHSSNFVMFIRKCGVKPHWTTRH